MITRKELNYVNAWSTKAPYPGIDYAEKAAEKLCESVEAYKQLYKDKEYDIILSNGEQFEFEIQDKNLCHMLGVHYNNLSGEYFDRFRTEILKFDDVPRSYDLLNAIVDNIDDVLKYDYDRQGIIFNYYRVMVKCSIFEKLSDFGRFNFGVINFDKNEYCKVSKRNYSGNAEKFLYVQSNEQACPYFMMGILQEDFTNNNSSQDLNDTKKFAVETLFAANNIGNFFYNQKTAIPTQILITTTDEMIKKEASASNKIALLNQYKAIVSEYGIPSNIDIYGDYMATLSTIEEKNKSLTKTKL